MATHSSVLAWRIARDGGARWAAVYGVAQSQTRLKQLSSSSSSNVLFLLSAFTKHPNSAGSHQGPASREQMCHSKKLEWRMHAPPLCFPPKEVLSWCFFPIMMSCARYGKSPHLFVLSVQQASKPCLFCGHFRWTQTETSPSGSLLTRWNTGYILYSFHSAEEEVSRWYILSQCRARSDWEKGWCR